LIFRQRRKKMFKNPAVLMSLFLSFWCASPSYGQQTIKVPQNVDSQIQLVNLTLEAFDKTQTESVEEGKKIKENIQ
ncbi:hypothetical protein ACFL6P_09675, partial [Candidatus Latescibacterota bacterium]